ncbi:MAG: high frequency lysogenization protein HflD [Gammaproteobacteria bacterium]|nr:high frequency lysogenization protein HflD [Gammaproteobacteria bacterium]
MTQHTDERLLALAGIFQATRLVYQVATEGKAETGSFTATLNSALQIEAPNTEAVYGGVANLRLGLETLSDLFNPPHKERDLEIARYALSAMHLERKLLKDVKMLKHLSDGLAQAHQQSKHFPVPHENIVAALANVYSETVSQLQPRIIVAGREGHLMVTANANKVRALLLGAVRSAVLWRQKGGMRLHLIFGRGRIIKNAKALLKTIGEVNPPQ